ncbi:EI24 domain-containing protein [Flavimarina sp. Hel_I_48]|uniref:EI24 domain-containing protein n=1 Tax=Flavimarina sp. Hel_I_48 TaxID=1392488 RepID=UPI0004DEF2B6|nr:EI24 domain-containing protein [Flavimarina sp. Hel_I_48]
MIKSCLHAINAYRRSFRLINELGLWKYYMIPMVISLLTAVIIGFSAWGFSDDIGALISRLWFWEWGAKTFATVSTFFGGLLVILLGLILFKHVVMAFSAPFMSSVSEKIEMHLYGKNEMYRDTSNMGQLWRGIGINMRNLVWELLITLPLLLLGLIPVVNFITTPLAFLVQAYYAGFGNMDCTLERHFSYQHSVDFVKKNRGLAIGNGIVFMGCLLIPIIGIILVLPLSITAASVVTLQALEDKKTDTTCKV